MQRHKYFLILGTALACFCQLNCSDLWQSMTEKTVIYKTKCLPIEFECEIQFRESISLINRTLLANERTNGNGVRTCVHADRKEKEEQRKR